jgi:ClpX C4-type zinc finger
MPEETDTHSTSGLDFITNCMNAIGERRYRDAITVLDKGLGEQLAPQTTIDVDALLKRLQTLLAYLEFRLEEDFGEDWDVSSRKRGQKEVRCSFCGKTKDEADEIIAGPGVFICRGCIKECADTLATRLI